MCQSFIRVFSFSVETENSQNLTKSNFNEIIYVRYWGWNKNTNSCSQGVCGLIGKTTKKALIMHCKSTNNCMQYATWLTTFFAKAVFLEETKAKSEMKVLVAQSCSDCGLQPAPGSSVMLFPRQEYWNGSPFPSPEDLPSPGIESSSPLQADSLLSEP